MNKLVSAGPNGKEVLDNPKPRYLLNNKNGRVFCWQPILAVDKKYVDCDINGNKVGSPKGNDPYILQESTRVALAMSDCLGSDLTLKSYGEELSRRGAEKYKSLESGEVDYVKIESDNHRLYKSDSYAWVYDRIEESVSNALAEIQLMTLNALHKINGTDAGIIRPITEVSYQWQIDQVKSEIRND